MKFPTVFSGLAALALAASFASADRRTATIFIQPIIISSPSSPVPLASIEYEAAKSPASANTGTTAKDDEDAVDARGAEEEIQIVSYEAPELPEDAGLVRVGVWDDAAGRWTSGTTVARAENFAKGYAPTLAVTVTPASSSSSRGKGSRGGGDIIGVAVKGVAVDAGYTRDFGPKAVLVRTEPGRQVDLNRPVVLGPEGRKVEPEPEKSLLQKYWWVIGIVVLLTMTGGGGEGGGK